jgi:hypothetical protein
VDRWPSFSPLRIRFCKKKDNGRMADTPQTADRQTGRVKDPDGDPACVSFFLSDSEDTADTHRFHTDPNLTKPTTI